VHKTGGERGVVVQSKMRLHDVPTGQSELNGIFAEMDAGVRIERSPKLLSCTYLRASMMHTWVSTTANPLAKAYLRTRSKAASWCENTSLSSGRVQAAGPPKSSITCLCNQDFSFRRSRRAGCWHGHPLASQTFRSSLGLTDAP
jgi:hypothetical protein